VVISFTFKPLGAVVFVMELWEEVHWYFQHWRPPKQSTVSSGYFGAKREDVLPIPLYIKCAWKDKANQDL
jgi:hypothetical protein